jgi:HSP20 family protein
MILRLKNDGGLTAFGPSLSDFSEAVDLLDDTGLSGAFTPAVNVSEDDDEYTIEVAIPGMDKEDFNVSVNEGILTISADAAIDEEEEDDNGYTYREYNYNSFSRSFELPEDAVEEGIEANYEDGELIISIPKTLEWVSSGYEIEVK